MKTLSQTTKQLSICVALMLFTAAFSSAGVLLQDTFDVSASGNINSQTNLAGRQSGTLAPLDYTGTNGTYLGDASLPNGLLLKDRAVTSPNHNFNDVGKNYCLSFDVKLDRIAGTGWAGLELRFGTGDQADTGSNPGFFWWLQKNTGGPVLYTLGHVAALGNRSRFLNAAINSFEDKSVHVNCLVSTESYGGADKVTTALFVDGEPITARQRNGSIGYGTVFELDQALTDNYNIISYGYDASSDIDFELDNLTFNTTQPAITSSTWTDDASSLVNSNKVYTHAVNCAGANVTINGVTFTGTDSQTDNPADPSWQYMDYNNYVGAAVIHGESTSVTGNGAGLATDYFYSRISSTLMLFHLTPGQKYTLMLYNNNSTHPLDTRIIPSDSEAALNILDQNDSQGSIFTYTYTAPASGILGITFDNSPVDSGDAYQNWRLYAFSNEEVVPEASMIFGVFAIAGMLIRKFNK
ncbi:MAG: hypothetical protein DRI44_06000 [Chlamydiae bacterium]|nr:MAG: hypothetical protein DRI44_06000 [Chlamydiota bacterium]